MNINQEVTCRVVQLSIGIQSVRQITARILREVNCLHASSCQPPVQFCNLVSQLRHLLVGILGLQVKSLANLDFWHDVHTSPDAYPFIKGCRGINVNTCGSYTNTKSQMGVKALCGNAKTQ